MGTYAVVSDVQAGYEQAIPSEQDAYVLALIAEAELILGVKVPNLADRITAGAIDADVVTLVVARVVRRVLRNPQGYTTESDGTYSYRVDQAVASGLLDFTDADLALVTGARKRAGIRTIGVRPASAFQIPEDAA